LIKIRADVYGIGFCQTFRVRNCPCNVSFTSVKSTKYKKFPSVDKNFLDLVYEPRRVSFGSATLNLFSDDALLQNLFHYFSFRRTYMLKCFYL